MLKAFKVFVLWLALTFGFVSSADQRDAASEFTAPRKECRRPAVGLILRLLSPGLLHLFDGTIDVNGRRGG
jgi:hypothetical protein